MPEIPHIGLRPIHERELRQITEQTFDTHFSTGQGMGESRTGSLSLEKEITFGGLQSSNQTPAANYFPPPLSQQISQNQNKIDGPALKKEYFDIKNRIGQNQNMKTHTAAPLVI